MPDNNSVEILVVDDSSDTVETLRILLASGGYSVRGASDGIEALQLVEQSVPHCVILDVRMPRMDGLAFARQLRARYKDDIVLIAMSAHAASDPEVRETFGIVDHYLRKPFDLNHLGKILPDLTSGRPLRGP